MDHLSGLVFPGRLHIYIRTDSAIYFAMLLLKGSDALPNQHQNMAVDGTPLVVCHKSQFLQHFFLDANGYTLNCHKTTPTGYIVCLFYGQYVVRWFV